MRSLPLILTLLISCTAFCQETKIDFTAIDRRTQSIHTASPAILSQKLTEGYTTELEKVRSIFRWVADNITYRTREYSNRPTKRLRLQEMIIDTSELKPLDERVAETVLENGIAICDGYARLFKTLCDYAGIKNEVITGYARGSKGNRRFGSNHTWNAVLVDNKWELMDITWASGYISLGADRFIQEFDENYFKPAPERFIEEHYPDNLVWTLMEDPPLMAEFRQSPYKQKTFTKYKISSYSPVKGLLEVNEGDTLSFVLESKDAIRDHQIFSDLFPDTSVYKTSASILLKPSSSTFNTTIYNYHVNSPNIKWLYLVYNDDVILRYRLFVKKDKAGLALID